MDAPADNPVTRPELLIVATPVLPLLHVPPVVASVSVIVEPIHTLPGPLIVPADTVLTTTVTADETELHAPDVITTV